MRKLTVAGHVWLIVLLAVVLVGVVAVLRQQAVSAQQPRVAVVPQAWGEFKGFVHDGPALYTLFQDSESTIRIVRLADRESATIVDGRIKIGEPVVELEIRRK